MSTADNSTPWDAGLFARQLGALGDRVRSARQSHAWSQQDLGNRAKIDRSNISRIEIGNKNFTLEVLWRLASTFMIHWADLLDDRTTGVPEAPHVSAPFEQQLHAFGTRIYQARVLQRLSQQALAGRIGVGPSTIYWVEDGTRNVTLETLSRLAAGLGVHWADLVDDRQTTRTLPDDPRGDNDASDSAGEAGAHGRDTRRWPPAGMVTVTGTERVAELQAICEVCLLPIDDGHGAVWVLPRARTRANRAAWHVTHDGCGQARIGYRIPVERIRTWAAYLHWTGHLMSKDWIGNTNWNDLIMDSLNPVSATAVGVRPLTLRDLGHGNVGD